MPTLREGIEQKAWLVGTPAQAVEVIREFEARYPGLDQMMLHWTEGLGPEEFKAGSVPGARNLTLADVKKAKDDGRLPMEDHNTRIIVFGKDGTQARAATEAIAKEAFHNVSYFGGSFDDLRPKIATK